MLSETEQTKNQKGEKKYVVFHTGRIIKMNDSN